MRVAQEIDAMATRLDILSPSLPTPEQQGEARALAALLRQFMRQLPPESSAEGAQSRDREA